MSVPPTVLTDADAGTWCESFEVTGAADGFDWSIRKTTIRGGPGDGIDVVEIDNGLLSVSIHPAARSFHCSYRRRACVSASIRAGSSAM